MDFCKFYVDTPARTYVDFGVVIHKDKFYVYSDSDDIWYKLVIGKGRAGSRELFVNSTVANYVDQNSHDKIVKADLKDSDNFREYVGTELTPDNPNIARYYKALNNIPTSIHITFSNVYVDVLTVIELSKYGARSWQTLKTYAIRNVADSTLAGYVSAAVVNGILNSTPGSAKHTTNMSVLRKFIRQVIPGEIEVFGAIRRWSNGEFFITAHYPTPAEDAAEDIYYKWHSTFIDATLAHDDQVTEPAKDPEDTPWVPVPEAPNVIRWPYCYTIKGRKYVVHADPWFVVGDSDEPHLMIEHPTNGSRRFVSLMQPINSSLPIDKCITADNVKWTILEECNCSEYYLPLLQRHKEAMHRYNKVIVLDKCYVDISKHFIADIPMHGNRRPATSMNVYKVHYFDKPGISYISTYIDNHNAVSKCILFKINELGPGYVYASSRAAYNISDVTIREEYAESAEACVVAVSSVPDPETAITTASVATTESVEKLYEHLVPRLDSIAYTQDETKAAIKWNNGKLDDLRNLIEDGHTAAVTQHKVINDNTRQCLEAISKGNHAALESAKEEINKRFDTMCDKFDSLGQSHSTTQSMLNRLGVRVDNIKQDLVEQRSGISGIVEVMQRTLEAVEKEFNEAKDRQIRMQASVDNLTVAAYDIVQYQERILQNQERKGFWNWLKSLFKK